ncbi:DUF255 domain-containing protein [Flavobacterium filum]|uniref:DUF255 domain-containing protein n=1 Tax=Flavobacterium TaxID=237 RepID=UPI0003F8C244|nr:DUF255 domain-containing protein [Flavobacterium filum]
MRFTLLFIFISQLLFSQKVKFESDINVAFDKAKKENKLVFVEYYNSTCTICLSIEPLFDNAEMADFYNQHFVSYKINTRDGMKSKDSLFMASQKLKFQGVPFFLFFDTERNFVHYSGAKAEVDYLINIGKKALNPEERTGSLAKKYNSGDRSIKTLYSYSDLVQLYQDVDLCNTISNELYQVYPKENLKNNQSYLILKNTVNHIDNGFFQYWYEHLDDLKDFEKGAKKGTEIKVLEKILLESIQKDKDKWDLAKIQKVKAYTIGLGLSKTGNDFLWEEESKALKNEKKSVELFQLMSELLEENKNNVYGTLFITEFYLKLFNNKVELEKLSLELDHLKSKEMEPEQKGDWFLQKLIILQKLQQKEAFLKLKNEALTFYKQNQLDLNLIENL